MDNRTILKKLLTGTAIERQAAIKALKGGWEIRWELPLPKNVEPTKTKEEIESDRRKGIFWY